MILETDFLDHWKTRMLVDILQDESATNCVLRLWFHCQVRRAVDFPGMTAQALKAVCRFAGDAKTLMDAMSQSGFIVVTGEGISVPKWAEANSKMFSNWENGKKGGRRTQSEPNTNPTATQTEIGVTQTEPEGKEGKEGLVGRSGRKGLEEVEGRSGAAAAILPIGNQTTDQGEQAAKEAVKAYQIRRYSKPRPDADYYPVVLEQSRGVFAKPEGSKKLTTFLAVCQADPTPKLPEDASFSDLLIAAGLKFAKASKARDAPQLSKRVLKDYTAERLAGKEP